MEQSSHQQPMPEVEGVDISHRWITVNGIKIHIAEAGEGEPLLMYHGWPQHWWMWKDQIPFFSKYFKVIVPDMRGFGWSDAPSDGYLKEQLADELALLINTLGYDCVRLLSHDWGGWIGYLVTARYPGLISQHFAMNIPPIFPTFDWKAVVATLRFGYMLRISMPVSGWRMLQRSGKFVHYLLTRGGTRREGWPDYEKNIFSDQFKDIRRGKASARLYGSFLLREYIPLGLTGKYKHLRIQTPTRLLFGTQDFALAVSWMRNQESYFVDYQVEYIEYAGHFIVNEFPDLVNERAFNFFKKPTDIL